MEYRDPIDLMKILRSRIGREVEETVQVHFTLEGEEPKGPKKLHCHA